jgi:crotonobetainyl-CoA:carnitine CoA-transferase CaiB-like acyl-CoA transferase
MLACNAILAALNARTRTDRGQKVEVSLYETSLFMLANVASNYLAAGRDGARFGNGHPSIVPYTTYPTADAMIAVAVGNDTQFAKLAAALGHPEWAQDARFAKNRDRVENRETVDGMIARALAGDGAEAWLAKLKAVGVPCGRINTVAQALDDPHTDARQMVEIVEHASAGSLRLLGIPFKLGDTEASVRRPPPLLGQHTDEILARELGMDADQIAALRTDKVI